MKMTLNLRETADFVGVSYSTLRRWRLKGQWPQGDLLGGKRYSVKFIKDIICVKPKPVEVIAAWGWEPADNDLWGDWITQ